VNAKRLFIALLLALGLTLLALTLATTNTQTARADPGVIYVDVDAPGPVHDGISWTTAYTSLQSALSAASSGDEIWVAEGTYKPTTGGNRSATFQLLNGVAIYGGFGGYGTSETLRTQRDWATHVVTLSGDIGTVEDPSDNSYHVVTGSSTDETALLDGFTVTMGNANNPLSPDDRGGGMYNDDGSPTLTNVTFSGNAANFYGGGMYSGGGSPTLTNVTFSGNHADYGGGGMHNSTGSPTLTNVTFSGNAANFYGGGMYSGGGSPTLTNCILWGNTDGSALSQIDGSAASVSYSLVQGWHPGTGNIHADPRFVDADGPDDVVGTLDDDLRLLPTSPAIDAGDNLSVIVTTDLAGEPRLADVLSVPDIGNGTPPIVDMGAYETNPLGVWLVKTGTPPFPAPGELITYTLTFANDASTSATDVVITDTVPVGHVSNVTYASSVPITQTSPGYAWRAGDLAPGAGGTITITGLISPALTGPSWFTNTATITATVMDANTADNQSSVRTLVPGIIHVDADAPGPAHDGISWTTAYTTVQAALDAVSGEDEIWVAEGVYTPTNTAGRDATFSLVDGTRLYGGFGGHGISETLRIQRDWETYVSVLSGDLDGNDVSASGVVTATDHITGSNAYRVVTAGSVTGGVVLDGFTITGGYADGSDPYDDGGGMHNGGDATLAHVTFSGNYAEQYGGGMYNSGSAILEYVTFSGNVANYIGGGIYNRAGASATPTHVTFSGNYAEYHGGGMHNNGDAVLEHVTFSGNVASSGGGMFNPGDATLTHVVFDGNHARISGGGMYNMPPGNATLTHITFDDNSAVYLAGGMGNTGNATLTYVTFDENSSSGGGGMFSASDATLTHVTFRHNSATNDTGIPFSLKGGGVYNQDGDLALTDVTFEANRATLYGGGLYNEGSDPRLANVVFSGNSADHSGGGMYNAWFDFPSIRGPMLVNVLFSGNVATNSGGGMFNYDTSPAMVQVTFGANVAQVGGGIFNYGTGASPGLSRPVIRNSIFWHNQDQNGTDALAQIYDASPFAMSNVAYSLVEGGCPPAAQGMLRPLATCANLLTADPQFVRSPDPGDGDWATPADNDYGDLRLRPGSPAIDAGDNTTVPTDTADLDDDGNTAEPLPLDLAGSARILDVAGSADTGNGTPPVVDMGAYEAAWADLQLTKTAAPATAVPGAAITYTLIFSNAGSLPATGVVITDTIPLNVTATSVVSSGVAITQTSPGYVWTVQDLAPGEGGVITIAGVIRSPLAGGTFTNTATIGTTAADGDTTNNGDAAGVFVGHRIHLPVVGRGAYVTPFLNRIYLPIVARQGRFWRNTDDLRSLYHPPQP
jgi:uncharacterized repeat protein (TIGR01451 family)